MKRVRVNLNLTDEQLKKLNIIGGTMAEALMKILNKELNCGYDQIDKKFK